MIHTNTVSPPTTKRVVWLGAFAVALGCVLLSASSAAAEVQLAWHAPDGCPDAATVTRGMREWLAMAGTPAQAADVQINADVEPTPSGYMLDLRLEANGGARRTRLFSATCDVFARVIAVQASLLVTEQTPRPDSPSGPSLSYGLRAHALLTSSPMPAPALGLGVAGYVDLSALRVELAASYVFAREQRFETRPDIGGQLRAGYVSIRPCAVGHLRALELAGCVGFEAGLVRGQGFGVENARSTDRNWFAVVGGAGVSVPVVSIWHVWLGADLLVSLRRPEFFVANLGPLYRPDRLGVRGNLGIEARGW